jgi:MYXO-CTERM domain-containing protein
VLDANEVPRKWHAIGIGLSQYCHGNVAEAVLESTTNKTNNPGRYRTMKLNKRSVAFGVALALAGVSGAQAATFINGDFETGDTSGLTFGGGYRLPILINALNPNDFLPGGSVYVSDPNGGFYGQPSSHSAIVAAGTVDPNVGAAFGTTVYGGNYSLRVEDTTYGGYASVATQTVNNYTDPSIFFAWKAVLLGAHGTNDAATLVIRLTDMTTGTDLITRQYNAASGGGGVDPRFSLLNNNYYTADWQIEQLSIDASLAGHNFLLSVLAADCEPTGHWGYVYLDGFGNVAPPPTGVPEPTTLSLAGLGLLAMAGAAARRRRQKA